MVVCFRQVALTLFGVGQQRGFGFEAVDEGGGGGGCGAGLGGLSEAVFFGEVLRGRLEKAW